MKPQTITIFKEYVFYLSLLLEANVEELVVTLSLGLYSQCNYLYNSIFELIVSKSKLNLIIKCIWLLYL